LKIKNKEIEGLVGMIVNFAGGKEDRKFAYCLVRNKDILETHVKALRAAQDAVPDSYIEHEKERIELCKEYCLKDENGKCKEKIDPRTKKSVFDLDFEKMPEFEEKITELEEKNKEAVEAKEDFEKQLRELAEEEVEIDFYQVSLDRFPEKISGAELDVLKPLIKED